MSKYDDYTQDQNEIIGAFIQLIKKGREAQGLSVRNLAEKAGISYTVIYDLENRNILPKIETINKLAHALGLSINIKCCDIDNTPSLSLLYCKNGYENDLFARLRIKPIHSTTTTPEEQFDSYLTKKGLYQRDIEEIKSFIEFKLSQH